MEAVGCPFFAGPCIQNTKKCLGTGPASLLAEPSGTPINWTPPTTIVPRFRFPTHSPFHTRRRKRLVKPSQIALAHSSPYTFSFTLIIHQRSYIVITMSNMQDSSAPATLRDLVMTSSPLPRNVQRFAAPSPPASQIHVAGSNDPAIITQDTRKHVNNNGGLIPSGPAKSAIANGRSTTLIGGKAPQDAIVVPGKHVALFIAALDRMVSI